VTWAVAAASLLATWLNVRGQRACFWIWLGTNATWAVTCATHDLPAQACLHVAYASLVRWARHPVPLKRG
jgi:hypothetical protein